MKKLIEVKNFAFTRGSFLKEVHYKKPLDETDCVECKYLSPSGIICNFPHHTRLKNGHCKSREQREDQ